MALVSVLSNLERTIASHPALIVLCTMLLVELTVEMIFQGGCHGLRKAWLVSPLALACNAWLLSTASVLLYAATNRLAVSLLFVLVPYVCLVAGNLIKTAHIHATLQPMDFVYLPETMHVSASFLGVFGIAAVILVLVGALVGTIGLWNWGCYAQLPAERLKTAMVGVLGLVGGVAIVVGAASYGRVIGIGMNCWDSIRAVKDRGLLLEMLTECRFLRRTPPPHYTEADVAACISRYRPAMADVALSPESRPEPVNLIFYLVESLIDPRELGVRLTDDPIPHLRQAAAEHTSGHVVIPAAFLGSANSEFELLTGMSMCFLPPRSCPYKQYIKRDLPSLVSLLKGEGYRTVSVRVDPRRFYNIAEVFGHLGFDELKWLADTPGTPRDAAGRWVADEAVVDAVIAASRRNGPFFIHTFPTSTHAPYDYDAYRHADLDAAEPLPPAPRHELKTYINIIREADRQLGRLFEHFRRVPEKTMIVVMGDHVPPMRYYMATFDTLLKQRRTPLLFWSNYLPKQPDIVCSSNFVVAHALRRMSIRPRGFLALNDVWSDALGVLSPDMSASNGGRAENDPHGKLQQTINDYRLMQWDLLFGHQYAQTLFGSASASACKNPQSDGSPWQHSSRSARAGAGKSHPASLPMTIADDARNQAGS